MTEVRETGEAGAMYQAFFDKSEGRVFHRRSLQAVRDMPTRDLTEHVFEGARHEVLHETNRDEVIGHLAEWLERFAPAWRAGPMRGT